MNTQSRTTRIERDPMYNLDRKLKIRGFSRKTIKTCLHCNRKFLNFARKSLKMITNEDIKGYLEYLANKKFLSYFEFSHQCSEVLLYSNS